MEKISFVIPCYRSENTILKVLSEIRNVMKEKLHEYSYEIVCVNDGSPDAVLDVLVSAAQDAPELKVIDLAKNTGQHAAMMAGMSYSEGDIVVLLDDDGQCPTDHLPELLAPLHDGYDVSIAQYDFYGRKESPFRLVGSRLNELMMRSMLGKPKGLGMFNFYAIKAFVVQEMLQYRNPYPYIDGLILRVTHNIAGVKMQDRPRIAGSSNYNLAKLLSLFMNGFTAFSIKPLRIATLMGSVISVCGFIFGIVIIIRKLLDPVGIDAGYSSIMAVILFIGGMLMLLLGICGEYIGRIYISINNSPQYVVRRTYNISENRSGLK